MKKWIAACLLTCMIFSISGISAFADTMTLKGENVTAIMETIKQEGSSVLTKPQDTLYVTTSDKVLLSGSGKSGDKVTIALFEKNADNNYVSVGEPIELTVGALEVFTREINLNLENSVVAKNSASSKEPYLIWVTLVRGKTTLKDLRFVKYSDKGDLTKNLGTETFYKNSLGH